MTNKRPTTSRSSRGSETTEPTAKGLVMGWHLPGERLTAAGWAVLVAVFALPVLALGMALDLAVQWAFGWCLGIWCWF